jgi:hypothetical protein
MRITKATDGHIRDPKNNSPLRFLSTQAEYMALTESTKEVMYLRGLFKNMIGNQNKPVLVYNNSQSGQTLLKI